MRLTITQRKQLLEELKKEIQSKKFLGSTKLYWSDTTEGEYITSSLKTSNDKTLADFKFDPTTLRISAIPFKINVSSSGGEATIYKNDFRYDIEEFKRSSPNLCVKTHKMSSRQW